jgi:predicted ATP-binding protein involved in virulence
MKVKRLKMQSFRGIGDLTLEFPADEPIVLIGINGVGKSSILDCLAILLSQLIARIQTPAGSGRDFSGRDITNGFNETLSEITISIYALPEVTWVLSRGWQERQKGEPTKYIGIASDHHLESVVDEIHRRLQTRPEANLPLAVYYPINRTVLDTPLEILEQYSFDQIVAYEQALIGQGAVFVRFFQWFRNLEDVENEERLDNPNYRNHQLEAVRQAIYSILLGFSNLRVRRSPLRMTVTKQDQELIINQLSDGEKCLLAMVGDLARRLAIANPSLPDPLQGSGVVLIDEIELHLHPKWQREIIPALTRTFPNCQFIVTTHSPQVISQVKPEGIYILERTDAGIVAMRPESSYGRDSNRILEDLMDTPERPQEIKESLLELFRLIARGELDSARQLHQKIADKIGVDEPELVGASVSIRRREILGR